MARKPQDAPMQQSLKALLGLRALVLQGGVEPGKRLSEIALSERLNVSRTPLRAALQRLEQEHLVELIPSGGYAVRRFTHQEAVDSIELRGTLEGVAARFAAERGVVPARLKAAWSIVHALDETLDSNPDSFDFSRYEQLNEDFHETLADLSGSDVIRREIARVTSLPFASPSAFTNTHVNVPGFLKTLTIAQSQHRAIISAIEMREGARAEALAREHARLARQTLDFVMEEKPDLRTRVPALTLLAV
ncbi:MAG: GntR family transcriptional regulator [Xanthobacteraceae bacterium]|nr:MAG: GntR family transcriptional regulator [Xanthobacteraceae bacterium]